MTLTTLTIQVPVDVLAQIDARLPPAGVMTREELASLMITLGLISSPQKIEVLTECQILEFRQRKITEAKSGLMGILRSYLAKIRLHPTVAELPTEVVSGMEAVIGAAMGTGWVSAAHAIQHYGAQPADIIAACKSIGQECDYNIEVL